MKKVIIILAGLFVLSACATKPEVARVEKPGDYSLNCQQLSMELSRAQQLKQESRRDDKFKLKYMMPMTAIMSVWNINKADNAATKRIKRVNDLMTQKGCSAGAGYAASGAAKGRYYPAPAMPQQNNPYTLQQTQQPNNTMMQQGMPPSVNSYQPQMQQQPAMNTNNYQGRYQPLAPGRYRPKDNPAISNNYTLQTGGLPWKSQSVNSYGNGNGNGNGNVYPAPAQYQPTQPTAFGGAGGGFGNPEDQHMAEQAFQQGYNPTHSGSMNGSQNSGGTMPPPPSYSKELEHKTMQELGGPGYSGGNDSYPSGFDY